MQVFRKLCRVLALPIAVTFLSATMLTTMPRNVHAGLVTTEQAISDQGADRARVQAFLSRDDVRKQFQALGIDPDEAAARSASLTDEEIRRIAGRLDTLPAGQGALGAVLGAAVVIFIVLLITDILGLTNIFPFVRR